MSTNSKILLLIFIFGCNNSSITEPTSSDSSLFISINQRNEPNNIIGGINILNHASKIQL